MTHSFRGILEELHLKCMSHHYHSLSHTHLSIFNALSFASYSKVLQSRDVPQNYCLHSLPVTLTFNSTIQVLMIKTFAWACSVSEDITLAMAWRQTVMGVICGDNEEQGTHRSIFDKGWPWSIHMRVWVDRWAIVHRW